MLNLFQHLTNKHRLKKYLTFSTESQNDLLSEKIAALENDSKQQMIKEVKKIASKNERAGGVLTTFVQN